MKFSLRNRIEGPGGYREFLTLAVPLVLSSSAFTIQEFVDRIFLTWYSAESIAAATPAGILNFAIMSFFIGTAGYVSTFVAQYHGAGQHHRVGPSIWQGLYVAVIGGAFMVVVSQWSEPIFRWVGHDPGVRILEARYFKILCWGGFFGISNAALSGFFTGLGRPWPVMWSHFLSTGLNMAMNYCLIFGNLGFPEMGIRGAGVATVVSSGFGLVLLVLAAGTRKSNEEFRILSGFRPERELFKRLLRFGSPAGAQFILEMAGYTSFILLVGRLGTESLAATNITFNINMLSFLPTVGAGISVSVLVGKYIGASRPDLAERSVFSAFHLVMGYIFLVAASYTLVPDWFLAPFLAGSDPGQMEAITDLSRVLLHFVAVYCIFDAMNMVFSSAIKGAGDTRFVMITMVLASVFVLAGPTYMAIFLWGKGLVFSYVILTIHVALLGLVFLVRFLGGRWKSMRVIEEIPPLVSSNLESRGTL